MAEQVQLEGGTYEILQNRLAGHAKELRARLDRLNEARKAAFGTVESELLAGHRITTLNNCVPRDIVCIGQRFLFGYNVQFGLKSTIAVEDVFGIYEERDGGFAECPPDFLNDARFREDFVGLYKYYKNTAFAKFHLIGPHLYMVFRTGRQTTDIKTFKWLIRDGRPEYIDNRSDHEFRFPPQHDFEWKRTHRDMQREGRFPHVSIEDRLFIETLGGDLTIKVEDNTESGEGIYSEPVDHKEQTLDDAEFFYAIVGPLILLRIRPYQEKAYRYFVYNEKLKTVARIDAIERACILLPNSQGLIFSNGFVLQTGELKIFENDPEGMLFERRVAAPNGEDHLYAFHHREKGLYILLSYNLIDQRVDTPLVCNGYSLFADGRMVVSRADAEPQKHHTVQVWQTPFAELGRSQTPVGDDPLAKVGNKDIVRAMADCQDVLKLVERGEAYELVYTDIARQAQAMKDAWFWLAQPWAFNMAEPLAEIGRTASATVDEFRKVTAIRRSTREQLQSFEQRVRKLFTTARPDALATIDDFVKAMAEYRSLRGQCGTLRDLRYSDTALIDGLEKQLVEKMEALAAATVTFLLGPDALAPYSTALAAIQSEIVNAQRGVEVAETGKRVEETAKGLDLLIDVVGNLKIDDPTRTAAIIERISAVYMQVNQLREGVKTRRRELNSTEAVAEFGAQLKLLAQSVANYLDTAETPARVDESLNKLLVQIEGLEGRFADFDEFIMQLAGKREEVQSAFEARKLALVEARNKKAGTLQASATRILKGVQNKAESLKEIEEINSYFAADLMVEKVRDVVRQLQQMGESVKADELEGRLKTVRENTVRQLKDRKELFAEGTNIIRFGRHLFSVNTQPLDLTIIQREGELFYHLTGTNFFDAVADATVAGLADVWDQELSSETREIYRGEYLAHLFLSTQPQPADVSAAGLLAPVQALMAPRYNEGYLKGVHDLDAAAILSAVYTMLGAAGLLRHHGEARAAALLAWDQLVPAADRPGLVGTAQAAAALRKAFGSTTPIAAESTRFRALISAALSGSGLFTEAVLEQAGDYLLAQLGESATFPVSGPAEDLAAAFVAWLVTGLQKATFDRGLQHYEGDPTARYALAHRWLTAFVESQPTMATHGAAIAEAAALLIHPLTPVVVVRVDTRTTVTGLLGAHARIDRGAMAIDLPGWLRTLAAYTREGEPRFHRYHEVRRRLLDEYRRTLRLSEFQPRVLTSFVRNKLIDSIYLPRIGDNFAKQMGTVGETRRTDLMGMLLLISPPGYGKTTLMEYVAHRLGLIFVKINGPALGHRVHSLDPTEAPNAGAREELNKLNLAFEMGDNVMIYIDDIQHCHPEFLQKFISLCDGQRRIEGVFRGRSRTYDLRGRKVAVVMAGNPYTETGDKFQIPDMLANRADTYNLGDMIGGAQEAFELSYIENCLTSNPVLSRLTTRSQKDLYAFVKLADTGSREGLDFEGSYTAEEQSEIVSVLKKLRRLQSVVLRVNQEYIRSAAQEEAYRTEPPFKLQGSYRNMNKLAEKIMPVMDDRELDTLISAHYEGESQTLTGAAEFNLLKLREMLGWATKEHQARLAAIRETFGRNLKLRGMKDDDPMVQLVAEVGDFSRELSRIHGGLEGTKDVLREGLRGLSPAAPPDLGPVAEGLHAIAGEARALRSAPAPSTPAAATGLALDDVALAKLRLMLAASARPIVVLPPGGGSVMRGERDPELTAKQLMTWLNEEGWTATPLPNNWLQLRDEAGTRLTLAVGPETLYFQADVATVEPSISRHIYRDLLSLNTQILPLSIGIDTGDPARHRILVLETRDRSVVSRDELMVVLRTFQSAVDAAKALVHRLVEQAGSGA